MTPRADRQMVDKSPRSPGRSYRSRKRDEQAAATRRRITEAAVALHGSVGPARTTLSGIAEKAGVTRVTVYQHFPTLELLFNACSAHWLSEHPWPDVSAWERIDNPDARLRQALSELYAFFRSNESMVANLNRDLASLPPANQERIRARPARMAAALLEGRGLRSSTRRRAKAILTHSVEFETWHSLSRHGLTDDEIVELLTTAVPSSVITPAK